MNMATPCIAAMTANDLDSVCAIEAAAQRAPWSRRQLLASLQAGHGAWLAQVGADAAGFVIVMHAVDDAELLLLSVAPQHQGCGVGFALHAHVCALAVAAGMLRMLLEVGADNQRAIRFYQRAGYVEIGRRRAYYRHQHAKEDAIVMAMPLAPRALHS